MGSFKQKYDNFCEFMQDNTKGVEVFYFAASILRKISIFIDAFYFYLFQIGIYLISGGLFAISYYKIRPVYTHNSLIK